MINLLPEQQKKAIRTEYRLRVFAVILIMTLVLTVLAIVSLIPSYGLALFKYSAAQSLIGKAEDTTKEKAEHAKLAGMFATVKSTLATLSEKEIKLTPMTITSIVVKHKGDNNHITGIVYSRESDEFLVEVRGIANTRQSLQAFTTSLRTEPGITSVDIPVSNFAQDVNINFSFKIHGKQ